jgi:hypothetical protein
LHIYPETKDPNETRDYAFDWSARLVGGETIEGSPEVEFVEAAGTSNPSNSVADGITRVWLSGGAHGERVIFTVRVSTSGGRTLEESFGVDIIDTVIGPAVETEVQKLTRLLGEARAARQALMAGERVTEVWRDGRRVVYAGITLDQLGRAILTLERELEAAKADEAGRSRRRAIRLGWRN